METGSSPLRLSLLSSCLCVGPACPGPHPPSPSPGGCFQARFRNCLYRADEIPTARSLGSFSPHLHILEDSSWPYGWFFLGIQHWEGLAQSSLPA